MDSYIRCPSCGFCLSKYYEFFDNAKIAINNEEVFNEKSPMAQYDIEKLILLPGGLPELERIFDAIGVQNICCRMRISTRMDYDRQFK
jgi:DNA-directed RNA polymerase subunit N (RpoN/RPB10)